MGFVFLFVCLGGGVVCLGGLVLVFLLVLLVGLFVHGVFLRYGFVFFNYLSLTQRRIQMMLTGTRTLLLPIHSPSTTPVEQGGPASPTNWDFIADGELSGWVWQKALCCSQTLWHRLRTRQEMQRWIRSFPSFITRQHSQHHLGNYVAPAVSQCQTCSLWTLSKYYLHL